MKIPKELNTFCIKCAKNALHSLSIYKAGQARTMAAGSRRHAGRKKGYGGQKFPKLAKAAKTTKKQVLIWKCKVCGRETMRDGLRLRKLEIMV